MTKKIKILIEASLSGKCGPDRITELVKVADLAIRRHDSGPLKVHSTNVWWENVDDEKWWETND